MAAGHAAPASVVRWRFNTRAVRAAVRRSPITKPLRNHVQALGSWAAQLSSSLPDSNFFDSGDRRQGDGVETTPRLPCIQPLARSSR
jgi:hypothetical protein